MYRTYIFWPLTSASNLWVDFKIFSNFHTRLYNGFSL